MTLEEFNQKQSEILQTIPEVWRPGVSYYAWEQSHAWGYTEVIQTLTNLIDEVILPGLREQEKLNDTERS